MSSRKNLKKMLDAYVGELLSQCALLSLIVPEENREKAFDIMDKLVDLRNDLIKRISHTEPGQAKVFYRQWKADLRSGLAELQADIEALIPT